MPEHRDRDLSKLPLGVSFNHHDKHGFHANLLANSLSSKLKLQRRAGSRTKHERQVLAQSTANGDTVGARVAKSILARQHRKRLSQQALLSELPIPSPQPRPGSGVSDRKVDSGAGSAHLPELALDAKRNSLSRRSNSASPVASTTRNTRRSAKFATPSDRAHSELAFLYSTTASEASGPAVSFEPRGPGRSVMVVKRDGVFQPLDKYAPTRQILREITPARKSGACEYEVYQISCDSSESGGTPRYNEDGKRGLKVSWSKTMNEGDWDENVELEEVGEERTVRSTPASTMRRTVSVDSFAFRRPVYSSGRSRVKCIGVKWHVPNVAKEEEKKTTSTTEETVVKKVENTSKPMWSYLVTTDTTRQTVSPQKSRGGHSSQPYHKSNKQSSKAQSTTSGSSGGVMRHSRDVHPVATAMNRQGTSVSKTKWTVPSSTSSTLEAERAIMGRLELVKKPGNQLLYDCPPTLRGAFTEHPLSKRTQDLMTQNTERSTKNVHQSEDIKGETEEGNERYEEEDLRSDSDDASTYSDSEQLQDETLSPTKSRSTKSRLTE